MPARMDAEITQLVGARLHERAETRLTYRNGYERKCNTPGGIELDIPKSGQEPSWRGDV